MTIITIEEAKLVELLKHMFNEGYSSAWHDGQMPEQADEMEALANQFSNHYRRAFKIADAIGWMQRRQMEINETLAKAK